MVNIPEVVKDLFKQDGVRKNFRIHFPNGESEDICNDRLIAESVSFTESLCSQSKLKFGLCESSVLKFECVGLPNVKGATIEAQIEIDCSSLDGIGETKDDLDYPIYSVKYGTFVIDSCDRSESNFQRRKVTAYSIDYTTLEQFNKSSFWQYFINGTWWKNDSALIPIDLIINRLIPEHNSYVDGNRYIVSDSYLLHIENHYINDKKYELRVIGEMAGFQQGWFVGQNYTRTISYDQYILKLNGVETYLQQIGEICTAVRGFLSEKGIENDIIENFVSNVRKVWKIKLHHRYDKGFDYNNFTYSNSQTTGGYSDESPKISEVTTIEKSGYYCIEELDERQYSAYSDSAEKYYKHNDSSYMIIPKSILMSFPEGVIKVEADDKGFTIQSKYTNYLYHYDSGLKKYYWSITKSGETYKSIPEDEYIGTPILQIERDTKTKQECKRITYKYVESKVTRTAYTHNQDWVNQLDTKKLLEAYCELQGVMGKISRDGIFSMFSLRKPIIKNYPSETLYPSNSLYAKESGAVRKAQYKKLWYADRMTEKIGAIKADYIDYSETDSTKTEFTKKISDDDALQTYDVSNNLIIANTPIQEDGIKAITDTIAENIESVQYMPCRVTMRGLPYLEAGDYITIETQDAKRIDTLIFRQTIKGIQSLTTTIETRG